MAQSGIGTVLKRSTDGGANYSVIGNVQSIDGPGATRDEIETTTLDNSDGYKDFIGGLRDGGTLPVKLLYDKTGYNTLLAGFNSDDIDKWQIVLPDGGTFAFDGFVKEVPLSISPSDAITFTCSIRIVGKPDFTV